jgi:hypothetical protein
MALAPIMTLTACCPRGGQPDPAPGPDLAAAAAWAAAWIERHDRGIALLGALTAEGVIELEWTDAGGTRRREPQVELSLRVDPPARTAVIGEKLGERLFWLGSDEDRYWFFDLMGDEPALFTGRHDEPLALADGTAVPVRPLALLDLLGLVVIPPDLPAEAIALDDARDAWVIATPGRAGAARVFVGRASERIIRVEILDASGAIALASDLRRHERADVPGVSTLAQPLVATLADVADPAGRVSIRLALEFVEAAREEPPVRQRLFDLDALIDHLAPSARRGRSG